MNKTRKKVVRYYSKINKVAEIPADQLPLLEKIEQRYMFRANDYYLGLIDWNDPADPIRRLVIPDERELRDWGKLDASNEAANYTAPGTQHKYTDTCLLLVTDVCGAYCRYCFRKRLFIDGNEDFSRDISEGLDYIRNHPEISNVLLTGGDPLFLSTKKLLDVIKQLREIDHVKIIRIGSKMPAFNPWRILDDPELVGGLGKYSRGEKKIYMMAHFDHPRELTAPAMEGLEVLMRAGLVVVNQNPLIKGINDDPDVLAELWSKLAWAGIAPYYLFQGRPTAGNEPFETTIVETWKIYAEARKRCHGLARRARLSMSHDYGKIEILMVDQDYIYLRFHRAKDAENEGRFMIMERDDRAFWFDQLVEADINEDAISAKYGT